jgi:hypothetical protein
LSYKNTSNSRLRAIFGSRLKSLGEDALTELKKNDVDFYDRIYGYTSPRDMGLGNTLKGSGFKYRGRGFNQLTGYSNYKKSGDSIGVDLVKNPDKANEVPVATLIIVDYFKVRFASRNNKLDAYNSTGINDFKDTVSATNAFYHANAGWGKSVSSIAKDSTGGYSKAQSRAPSMLEYITEKFDEYASATADVAKKKSGNDDNGDSACDGCGIRINKED